MNALRLPGSLVSVSWLSSHLDHPALVVLDASLAPVAPQGAPKPASADRRIPGARRFDFDQVICDRASSLPHMMPPAELFQAEARALGIGRGSVIVVYDSTGVYSSPRAWWMLKAMGHDQVAVLDGGLPAWSEAGLRCEAVEETRGMEPGDFVASPRAGLFCDADRVAEALRDPGACVLDARSEGRFLGREPEPRRGLRGGHMPGAVNLPFSQVQAAGKMRAPAELRELLGSRTGGRSQLVFSCGSGVTACILALAADLSGYSDLSVYDGSWSEWGLPSARPVVTDGE